MILVLALDAFDPELVTRFEREGRLPVLAGLRRRGLYGRLRSTFPPVSVPAWSSFLTGVGPGRHGLFDFTRLEKDRIRFQHADDRGTPTLLELLDAAGRRVASIGVPSTYPVPRLRHGAVLAGFDSPLGSRLDARGMHPVSLWRALAREGIDLRTSTLPEGRKGRGWHGRAAGALVASVERRAAQTRALLRRGPWDLVLVHFQAADTAGHHFFRYFDPSSPRYDARYPERAGVIPDVYARLDRAAGELLAACPTGTRCVVLSDHGMGAASDRALHLNRWLEEQGFLVRSSSARAELASWARQAALRWLPRGLQQRLFALLRSGAAARVESSVRLAGLDLARSRAFSEESSTLPGIWLCDPSCADELLMRLRDWEAVERVFRREDLYHGPLRERAPHLLLALRHPLVRTPRGYRGPALRPLELAELDGVQGAAMNGVHRPEGIFMAGGWPQASGEREGLWIGDLAPTLLGALDVPIPAWMEGRPIPELVPQPRWTEEPAASTAPNEAPLGRRDRARIERRLRALGYLG